ncbi:MAG: pantoate--beta-alanine ligase [Chloroflexi bacterium]|nr:pantoate--beta-alanine ligase [Chloroflexota bacterium]
MQTIRSIKKMQAAARQLAHKGKTIAVVPTMGYLHEGHLSLVRKAAKAADVVVVTIFANPTQFGPKEDFKKYPRDEKGDVKKIKAALKAATAASAFKQSIIFIPKVDDVYPDEFQTWVTVEKLTKKLEGAKRPEHFRGVTTIVTKLFNIIRPDVAFFGQKDFQQAVVLKQMVRDLGFPVKLVIAPIVREADGLAMSSRNAYFDEKGRWEAVCLYYALRSAKEMAKAGVTDCKKVEKEMRAVIKATCRTAKIDYIAFTDNNTLAPRKKIEQNTVCSLSVRVHSVRLIDNMKLG